VLGQPGPRLEGEENETERAAVNQSRLPVPVLGGMGLGPKPPGEIRQIEKHGGPEEPVARMGPESFVSHAARAFRTS
jgi:hypothetical protein